MGRSGEAKRHSGVLQEARYYPIFNGLRHVLRNRPARLPSGVLLRRFALFPLLAWAAGTAARDQLDALRDLVRAGRLEAAVTRIDAYLATQPGDPQARFLKSVVRVRQGRTEAAIVLLRRLAKDYPRLSETYNNLAVLYASRGDYEAAREALLHAVGEHPSNAIVQENLGDIYAKMAGDAYDKVLKIDPGKRSAAAKLAFIDQLLRRAAAPATGLRGGSPPAAAQPDSGVREAVRASLDNWARAWSRQDLDGYLAHYAPGFQPSHGLSRGAWERQRRTRLQRPARIEVKLSGWRFQSVSADQVWLSLIQDYRSDTYRDRVRKRFGLVKGRGGWRIASEDTLP